MVEGDGGGSDSEHGIEDGEGREGTVGQEVRRRRKREGMPWSGVDRHETSGRALLTCSSEAALALSAAAARSE